jgi:hypothetical protein
VSPDPLERLVPGAPQAPPARRPSQAPLLNFPVVRAPWDPLYDGPMDLRLDTSATLDGWTVSLGLSLDRKETNELFMLGDRLISWPTEGLTVFGFGSTGADSGAKTPFVRGGIFLSEIVAHPEGILLTYRDEPPARQAARVLEYQVRQVFMGP